MPPPIISESTFFIRFSITGILSPTFAPPIMATKGLSGSSRTSPRNFISFSIRNPETAGMYFASPAVEQCALCAVPKASFTKISPSEASSPVNGSSFFVSSALYLTFSRSITCPPCNAAAVSLTPSSTTTGDGAKITSCPSSSDSLSATGLSVNSGFGSPLGLPM